MAHRSESDQPPDNRIGDLASYITARYELIAIPVLMAFMFFTRYLSADNFRTSDGFYLAAIDSYYHWRSTMWSIENWPNTMPFDPWTNYPDGRYVGQFGTAFDQLIATVALIVGAGDPSEALIHDVVLVMIPLMAAFVAIPMYLIGKRLGGRLAGLGGVALLALFPGSFFGRSATGQFQHHVAEVLFMAIAIVAFMAALQVAERDKPIFEQLQSKDLHELRPTIGYSVLAGAALALYMWMWPSGVMLIGILGAYFVVYLSIEYAAGRHPEHLSFVGAISMLTTSVLMFGVIEELSTSPTSFGYIAPVLALLVAIGCVFMAVVARYWDTTDYDRLAYPGAIGLSVIVAMGLLWLVLPDVYGRLLTEFLRRVTPFGPAATDFTIQEAQPPDDFRDQAFREFGLALYAGAVGLIALVIGPFLGAKAKAEHGLIVVWALFIFSMSLAQVRFWYYLALVVAVLNAYLIGQVVKWADLKTGLDSLRELEGYQIITLATVLMILVVPLMPPVANATVADVGAHQGPHSDTIKWEQPIDTLNDISPTPGTWGGEDNELDYYGTYHYVDGSYDYPDGSYGVMTWWDFGHMLTTNGERIPRSNPFQTGASDSAEYLLADSEERGSLILQAIGTDADISQDTDALSADLANYDEDEYSEFRYVMVDDGMATGKLGAISEWAGPSHSEFVTTEQVTLSNGETHQLSTMSERYHDTQLASLYFDDHAGSEQYRLVAESEQRTMIGSVAQQAQDGSWQTVILNQDLGALGQETLAQIQMSDQLEIFEQHITSSVKTFEHVEGATITGEAEPEADVQVSLDLNTTYRHTTYTQTVTADDDGHFEVTVPYATTNELTTEDGYTDAEVTAIDDYNVTSYDDAGNVTAETTTDVPEPAIYDGETIEVTLEPVEDDA